MNDFSFLKLPEYAGHYRVGGSQGLFIYFKRKPPWINRVFSRWLLGWEWLDSNPKDAP